MLRLTSRCVAESRAGLSVSATPFLAIGFTVNREVRMPGR